MRKYICTVCGYIHEGDTPPEKCPICKVGPEMFKLLSESVKNIVGWQGYKEFRVNQKIRENNVVTSFYLKPVDNTIVLPEHEAGQYISIKPTPNSDSVRQYSLSMKPGEDFYRISVKREENGLVSKYLHDTVNVGDIVEITMPLGEFKLQSSKSPLVLISGGIGITPVMSMLYSATENKQDVLFVQASLNSSAHTFKQELSALKGQFQNVKTAVFYQMPLEQDRQGVDYDYEGFVTNEWMAKNLPVNGQFYFCGPLGFMKHINTGLKELGVQESQIHYEVFGPNVSLED